MTPAPPELLLLAPERFVSKAARPLSERGEAEIFLAPKRVISSDEMSHNKGKRPAKLSFGVAQRASIPPNDLTVLPKGRDAELESLQPPAQQSGAVSLVDFQPLLKGQSQSLFVNPGEAEADKDQHGVVDISTRRPPSFNTVIPSLARQAEKISQKTSRPMPPTPRGPAVGIGDTKTQAAKTDLPPLRRQRAVYDTLSLFARGLQRRKKAVATHLNMAFLLWPSPIIKGSLIHGRQLVAHGRTRFLQVGRQRVLALENGLQRADRRLLIAARQVSISTRPALAAAGQAQSKAKDFTSQILTLAKDWAKNQAKSLAERARRLQARAGGDRDGAGKLAQRSKAFAWAELSEKGAITTSVQTLRAAANNMITQVKAASAFSGLVKPSMASSLSDALENAGFPKISRSHYWALSSVAAASIIILIAIMAPKGSAPLDDPARVFPITDQPDELSEALKAAHSTLLPLDDPLLEIIKDGSVSRPGAPGTESAADVLKWLKASEELSQFTKVAEIVGLRNLLETGGPYTIFIPDDSAYTKLAPGELDRLLETAEHARLLNLLVHHIVSERLTLFDIAGRVQEVTSLAGQQVTIDATSTIRVGEAGMIDTDFLVGDFVVHVIDSILDVANP